MSDHLQIRAQVNGTRRKYSYQIYQSLTLVYENPLDNTKDTFFIRNQDMQSLVVRLLTMDDWKNFLQKEIMESKVFQYNKPKLKIRNIEIISQEERYRKAFKQEAISKLCHHDEKALIAFEAIKFIRRGDGANSNSSQQHIKQSFREKIINHLSYKFNSEKEWKLEQLKGISKLFQIIIDENQAQQNKAFMLYNKFRNSTILQGQIIFNPTSLTSQIFKKVLSRKSMLITTEKGGFQQSTSLWLLTRLSALINKISTDQRSKIRNNLLPFLNEQQFKDFFSFPSIFYVALTNNQNCLENIMQSIKIQMNLQNQSIKWAQILEMIKQKNKKSTTKTIIFIVDQINIYFSIISLYYYQTQQEKKRILQTLLQISQFLHSIYSNFEVIYSSSVKLQRSLITQNTDRFVYNFIQPKNGLFIQEHQLGIQQRELTKHSTIEFLHSVLYEISIRLASKNLESEIKIYNEIFEQIFKQLESNNEFKKYKNIKEFNPRFINQCITKFIDFNNRENYVNIDNIYELLQFMMNSSENGSIQQQFSEQKDFYYKIKESPKIIQSFPRKQNLMKFTKEQAYAIIAFETILQIQRHKMEENNHIDSFRKRIVTFLENKFYNFDADYVNQIASLFYNLKRKRKNIQLYYCVALNSRLKNAQNTSNNIVFNPTFLTSEIFQYILDDEIMNYLLIGTGGVGKTTSQWLLTCLAYYIQQINIKNQNKDSSSRIKSFLKQQKYQKFVKFPKVYYINLVISQKVLTSQYLIQIIKSQTPFEFKSKQLIKMIEQIRDYYFDKGYSRVIFIIDQINVYTSLIRQRIFCQQHNKKRQLNQKINTIDQLIRTIHHAGLRLFHIIYSSSINFQKILVSGQYLISPYNSQGFHFLCPLQTPQTKIIKIGKYKKKFTKDLLIEILQMLLFQIQIRENDKNYFLIISELVKEVKQNLEKKQFPISLYSSLVQVTSLKIFQYLRNNQIKTIIQQYMKKHSINSQNQLTFGKKAHFILILQLLTMIRDFSRSKLADQYTKFLNKGTNQVTKALKLQLFMNLSRLARKESKRYYRTKQFSLFLTDKFLKIGNEIIDLINLQNISFEEKYLIINCDPQAFLVISSLVKQPVNSLKLSFQKCFEQQQDDAVIFGFSVNKYYTSALAKQQVILTFEKKQYLVYGDGFCFTPFNSSNITVFKSLQQIIKTIQQTNKKSGNIRQFIGAQPRQKDYSTINYPANTQIIDCLILKAKQSFEKKYQLITFDLTVSKDQKYVEQKIYEAIEFFENLSQRPDTQDKYHFKDFQIKHYIVAPMNSFKINSFEQILEKNAGKKTSKKKDKSQNQSIEKSYNKSKSKRNRQNESQRQGSNSRQTQREIQKRNTTKKRRKILRKSQDRNQDNSQNQNKKKVQEIQFPSNVKISYTPIEQFEINVPGNMLIKQYLKQTYQALNKRAKNSQVNKSR